MAAKFMQMVLTPAVQAAQDRYFGHHQEMANAPERDAFTEEEAAFIAARDSFYMATTNSDGWPYLQHRGGPPGFLKVLGSNQLGFTDFKGNRQMLTTGNLDGDDRVALFLMDYPHRERLKILGHARVLDARNHPDLAAELSPGPELRNRIERVFLIEVVSFDWNCPQYITPRFTAREVNAAMASLQARIEELEEQLRRDCGLRIADRGLVEDGRAADGGRTEAEAQKSEVRSQKSEEGRRQGTETEDGRMKDEG